MDADQSAKYGGAQGGSTPRLTHETPFPFDTYEHIYGIPTQNT